MRSLTIPEVLFIHFQVMERFGGRHGVLNLGRLESAVARPQATIEGDDLYPSVLEKAAVLLHALVLNHPFQDGNTRTAFTALGLFLHYNGMVLEGSRTDAENFDVNVADTHVDVETIGDWLQSHARSINN